MEEAGALLNNTVNVSPLTSNMTSEHILEIFGNFGKIRNLKIEDYQMEEGQSRRALVSFESSDSANEAISHLDKGEIDGVVVKVSLDPPSTTSNEPDSTDPLDDIK
ncbi:RNA recognition motif domain-containing protein [Theileria equi strain WA]|uniref:RNA recognition motif domain-containing protein n=1 Tax=Theileria equi strain WA TaxID=1537102 RepID=L0B126_THEEQ|nr:RNA recognition motif domain-containing protein [Theileria equi strain WA]AFZ81567.1 RNA recognition motif domain-containing protein [Theileria equi strain WA]|eukprot:XP_004831233.1 RNA recognition motif domain-containing protein [Theileria equi strain WA]